MYGFRALGTTAYAAILAFSAAITPQGTAYGTHYGFGATGSSPYASVVQDHALDLVVSGGGYVTVSGVHPQGLAGAVVVSGGGNVTVLGAHRFIDLGYFIKGQSYGFGPMASSPYASVITRTAGTVNVHGGGNVTVGQTTAHRNAGVLSVSGGGHVTVVLPLTAPSYGTAGPTRATQWLGEQTFSFGQHTVNKSAAITLSMLNLIDSGNGYYTLEPGQRDAGFIDQTAYYTVVPGTVTDLKIAKRNGEVIIY